jgi:hypothetical protein
VEPVLATKHVKQGLQPTSPVMTSTPAPISSSISDITKAPLLEETSGSTSEPADAGEAATGTDGDLPMNELPGTQEAMVDIVKGTSSLSEPFHGSSLKAIKDDPGSERMPPEMAAADSDVGMMISNLTPTTHLEASQLIRDSDTMSASDPGCLSKKDEDVSMHCLQFHV